MPSQWFEISTMTGCRHTGPENAAKSIDFVYYEHIGSAEWFTIVYNSKYPCVH
jgi:hypothetical protein